MVDAESLEAVLRAMDQAGPAEHRRAAERMLEGLVAKLLDEKVRHGLGSVEGLQELVAVVQAPGAQITLSGAVILDRFRYRLAHVAMRNRQWQLAIDLLDRVLAGQAQLTRARLYRTVCQLRLHGSVPAAELSALVARHQQDWQERPAAPPLDVLVQDPTTCLLELLLLGQDSEPALLDQLYDRTGQHRSSGLKLLIQRSERPAEPVELSEWLAESQLEEWRREGWLVVDASVAVPGERGRGSLLRVPGGNLRAPIAMGLAQVLARNAPRPLPRQQVQELFAEWDDQRQVDQAEEDEPDWPRATSTTLADHPQRKVIGRSPGTRGEVSWHLIPPYVVVLSDAASRLRQAAGKSQ